MQSPAVTPPQKNPELAGEEPDDPENAWKRAVLDDPISRDERAVALRHIFDSLDPDSNHSVTRNEFLHVAVSRGLSLEEAKSQFSEMDETRTGMITVAKFDLFVKKRTITKVRDTFKEIDMQDGGKDRQLTASDVRRFFLNNGLSRDQISSLWTELDANKNGKVNFKEWRSWAETHLTALVVDETAASAGAA